MRHEKGCPNYFSHKMGEAIKKGSGEKDRFLNWESFCFLSVPGKNLMF